MSEPLGVEHGRPVANRFDYCTYCSRGFFSRYTVDQGYRSRPEARGRQPPYLRRAKQLQRKRWNNCCTGANSNEGEHGGVLNTLVRDVRLEIVQRGEVGKCIGSGIVDGRNPRSSSQLPSVSL